MRHSIFSTAAAAVVALMATPALANETTSTEVEVQAPESGQLFASALASVLPSMVNGSAPAALAQASASSCCDGTAVVTAVDEPEVAESPITGGVDVLSDYMLADGIRPTKGVVVQPWLSASLSSELSLNAWASKGLETDVGDEVDLGFTYKRPLGSGVTGRLVVNHYVLFGGVPDMQEITLGVETEDGFDLSASYFPWAGGLQDGFRVTVKYNFNLTPKLSASVGAVYETGMEADDTFVPQAGLTYDLGRGFSAKLNAYFPHRNDGVHERRVVFGIGWGF